MNFPDTPITPRAHGEQWTTITLKPGENFKAVLIGPIRRMGCHWDEAQEASKPCRALLTEGKLKCYCADSHQRVTVRVYVPVMMKDGEQKVVLISATAYKRIESAAVGTVLMFKRKGVLESRTYVYPTKDSEMSEDLVKKARALGPQQISDYLVHVLWQDQTYIKWLADQWKKEHAVPKCGVKLPHAKAPTVDDTPAPRDVRALLGALTLDPNSK